MNASMITREELYNGEYFELQEAKEYLGISTIKLRNFIHEGEIKVSLLETKRRNKYKYFFKKEDLIEFKLFLILIDEYSMKKCA